VLVVEDEAALTRLISWFLLDAGFEVAVVASGDAALEKVRTFKPDAIVFNTVITDDAKKACIEQLRELTPNSRILDVSEEKNARAEGVIGIPDDGSNADASLDLPFPADRLIGAIRDLLATAP
jgi:DNA-binding response OmpR family regulator